MGRVSGLLFASPSHQLKRAAYVLSRAKVAVLGEPDRFPDITMEDAGDYYLGRHDSGFAWHVTRDDKSLVAWARAFIGKRVRFENRALIHPGDTVINVGACSGEYTLYASRCAGDTGLVYAFEPDPAHFACLKKNKILHGMDNVTAIPAGMSDAESTLKLHRIENAMAGGSVERSYGDQHRDRITSTIEIPCHRLDSFFADRPGAIRALVVTVNGHELEVIRGAEALLPRVEHVIYQSEAHWPIVDYLTAQGFEQVEAIYAGPEGGTDEHIALFKRSL